MKKSYQYATYKGEKAALVLVYLNKREKDSNAQMCEYKSTLLRATLHELSYVIVNVNGIRVGC